VSDARRVAIVADSTADLPQRLVEAEGITIIPLITAFPDGATVRDGELSQNAFFERMAQAKSLPTTSQPPIGEFAAVYERLLETFSSVVSIHISSRLSGTIGSAQQAAKDFGDRVRVFDSLNLSTAMGWQVLEAARAADRGANAAEVVAAAEDIRSRVRHVIGLDKLDNLARGGRIGAVSAFMGGLLDLKVLLTVDAEGAFQPVTRVRGHGAAMRATMEFVRRGMDGAARGRFLVAHALSPQTASYLRDAIAAAYEAMELDVVETGVVIATHTGTGWGVSFVPGD
jgi:DegV family protein with EDD domain